MTKPKVRRVEQRLVDVVYEGQITYGEKASSANAAARLLAPLIADEVQEVFCALLLNVRNQVTAYHEVTRGTLTSSLVHPREVFGPALRLGSCAAIIVAHNHPSGDPEPSLEDMEVTRRLRDAGKLLGVPLLDHLIVCSAHRFVSLRDRCDL